MSCSKILLKSEFSIVYSVITFSLKLSKFHNKGRRDSDRMVVGYTTIPMQSVPITNNVACSYLADGLWRGVLDTTGARGTDLPPPFFLTFCLQIYFQYNFFISLLFHLLFLILTCSCQYS